MTTAIAHETHTDDCCIDCNRGWKIVGLLLLLPFIALTFIAMYKGVNTTKTEFVVINTTSTTVATVSPSTTAYHQPQEVYVTVAQVPSTTTVVKSIPTVK
jgi:hypothetical protein